MRYAGMRNWLICRWLYLDNSGDDRSVLLVSEAASVEFDHARVPTV
jgi:hypothetical protein